MFEQRQSSPETVPVQPLSPAERLLNYGCNLDTILDDFRAQADELYSWLEAHPLIGSSCPIGSERERRETTYWNLLRNIRETTDHQNRVIDAIEKLESGELSEDEALDLMVVDDNEDTPKESKRRAAIRRQREKDGPQAGYDGLDFLVVALGGLSSINADARRLTTGRDRTRLVAAEMLDTMSAESKFFDVTADTHGGKSRHNGKSGKYYSSASGKRIRKR